MLIGGTSNTGKSTVARLVADRLGFELVATDRLARHPGRPWPQPDWIPPPHVAEHYRTLSLDELIAAMLEHHRRLRPRIAELITGAASRTSAGPARSSVDRPGLVLEGSALWPADIAALDVAGTAAVWLGASEEVLTARMHAASGYHRLPADDRLPIDGFLARSLRHQTMLLDSVSRLGSEHLDTGDGRPPEALAETVLAAVAPHPS
ncbi:AAA domain [Actinoalloteichus hymeniacidonis]|uniref:AAA domain n=1 Tax=Actinoalloteichus hymeniacidonis TaxID=340345 RepID=A0AAC9HU43_9PSEU|nr:AAA domain [Actinoalloteichus hymeniacidonis]